MLKFENITFGYNDNLIIKDLSFEIPDNKSIALTGDSGIGKTTLFYLLAGLRKAQKGKIISTYTNVSVVFQEPRLFPWLTALENITVTGASKEIAKKLIASLFDENDVCEKYPHELSGGMQQRIAIARALALTPDLLLLDEAFKGLDAQTKKRTANTVFETMKNKTCIFITHDMSELAYCDEQINISSSPISQLNLEKSIKSKAE